MENESVCREWALLRSFRQSCLRGQRDRCRQRDHLESFSAGELGLAIDKGEIDAVADSEPIGSF